MRPASFLRAALLAALALSTTGCLVDLAVAMMIYQATADNECEAASALLSECLNLESTGENFGDAECEGQALCISNCLNASDCDTIQDAFQGSPTSLSQPLLDCFSGCASQ